MEDPIAAGEGLEKAVRIQQVGTEESKAVRGTLKCPQVVVLRINCESRRTNRGTTIWLLVTNNSNPL
jgi:hypothetical protein